MIYHPTTISILAVILMTLSFRQEMIFRILALSFPLLIAGSLYELEGIISIELMNMSIIANFESHTVLIAWAFAAMLFVANLYAIGNHKKREVILGSSYAGFTYLVLFAGDMISLIVGLEVMMIISSSIIFIGGKRHSLRSAKKYFLTHLMSGNMIIIGVSYLIIKNGSTEIVNVTELMVNPGYSQVILAIMLTGLVMNVASFPFSGWMVNYYPDASPSGFIYLISFTTKVSVIVLLKLFAGYELLKYIAVIMILYASIKSVLENNFFSILCLLSIAQMGFMMIGVSLAGGSADVVSGNGVSGDGNAEMMRLVVASYLFMHILYKGLLSLNIATIADHGKIENINDLMRIKNPAIIFAFIVSLAAMINIPLSTTFLTKSYISHYLTNNPLYFIIIFLSMTTVIAVPWLRYLSSNETKILHLNIFNKSAIYFSAITVCIVTFAGYKFPLIGTIPTVTEIPLFGADSMKQLTIIAAAIAVALLIKLPRIHSNAINLTEFLGNILFYLYYHFDPQTKPEEEKESLALDMVERQLLERAHLMHNQQTAIFIVFTIFLIMLITFIVRGI